MRTSTTRRSGSESDKSVLDSDPDSEPRLLSLLSLAEPEILLLVRDLVLDLLDPDLVREADSDPEESSTASPLSVDVSSICFDRSRLPSASELPSVDSTLTCNCSCFIGSAFDDRRGLGLVDN